MKIKRSEDEINKSVTGIDFCYHRRFLHHTAAETDHEIPVFPFSRLQLPQMSVQPRICIFPHGAGVEDHQIRFFLRCFHITDSFQKSTHPVGIVGIHLTTESYDRIGQLPALSPVGFNIISAKPDKEFLPLRFRCGNRFFHMVLLRDITDHSLVHISVPVCACFKFLFLMGVLQFDAFQISSCFINTQKTILHYTTRPALTHE